MSESIEQIEPENQLPARRQKDRRDENKHMTNLLFILDRRKEIAQYHIEQNIALRSEITRERVKKRAWFELAIASWLVTISLTIGILARQL